MTPTEVKSEQEVTVLSDESIQDDFPQRGTDGGIEGWIQVFGCWLLFMNTWGLTNSFGIFETYYTQTLLTSSSPSAISWIGSSQTCLLLLVGVFTGRLLDNGYLLPLLLTGSFLSLLGMFLTSLCTQYWQFLLSQGICVGLGSGILGFTSVAVIPAYFTQRKMFAAGVTATGSAIAGIIYPVMMQQLFAEVGFSWAVRILALLMLSCLGTACVVLGRQSKVKKTRILFNLQAFQDWSYITFIAGYACTVASVYTPYFYIQDYALDLGASKRMSFYIISIMNAGSLLGRIPPNILADRYGGLTVLVPACLMATIVLFLWRCVSSSTGLICISAVYCFVTGGLVSLPPITIANMTNDPSQYGTRMGLGYTVAALGALVGNPIAGVTRRATLPSDTISEIQRRYEGIWLFSAVSMALAVILMLISRYLRHGMDFSKKM